MGPFSVGDGVGDVQAVVGPDFERAVVDVAELDNVVLSPDAGAVGLICSTADPAAEGEGGLSIEQAGNRFHEVIHTVEAQGGVVRLKADKLRRARSLCSVGCTTDVASRSGGPQAAGIGGDGRDESSFIQAPVGRRTIREHDLIVAGGGRGTLAVGIVGRDPGGGRCDEVIVGHFISVSRPNERAVTPHADGEGVVRVRHEGGGGAGRGEHAIHIESADGAIPNRDDVIPGVGDRCAAARDADCGGRAILIVGAEVPSGGALVNEPT